MPKQKSHRGAAKRFSITKTGKVRHKKMNANHILNKKTTKRIRHLRQEAELGNKTQANTIRNMIPYK